MIRYVRTLVVVSLLASLAQAEGLKIGAFFTDHMVLQRGKPTAIRGAAEAGADVNVTFADQEKTAKANKDGQWEVVLDPLAASSEGTTLTVQSGREKAVLKDVVVGDVFLFGRQTSIDISLGRDAAGKRAAAVLKHNPDYRAIALRNIPSPAPQSNLSDKATSGWRLVDKKQALAMTAAAFYLGRDLVKAVDVPVGIVDLNMGYHFPMAWLSRETLMIPVPGAGGVVGRVKRLEAQYKAFLAGTPYGKHKKLITENPVEDPLYPAAGYNGVLMPLSGVGFKAVIAQIGNDYPYFHYERAKAAGKMNSREAMNRNYVKTYDLRKVGFRMESGIITRLPRAWRQAIGDETLPIAFVSPPSSDLWTYAVHNREMRELQRKTADKDDATHIILPGMKNVPFSGQPENEALVAKRSLKWAIGALYSDAAPATGPLYAGHDGEGSQVTIHFKKGTATGLEAADGALDVFEVADVDAKYVPAKAEIEGETIQLSCDEITRIFYIRYNWRENPNPGLVNGAGLPAVPFRTEDAGHRWFVRYKDDDLPEEYATPANEWKSGAVTLINAQLERIGYPHFSGWLGPMGVRTGPFGPNMGVREVKKGSPAEGKLLVGDVIYSANGKMLGEEEEMTMSAAITASEAKDGKLLLGVRRGGENLDIELQLKVMGRYSDTAPWDCLKSERIVRDLEKYLAAKGAPGGFLDTDAMFLLGAGSPEYQWMVRKTATGMRGTGGNNWALGYKTQYLSEYYLATGDRRVLPQIELLCARISEMQIREDSRRNGGWYGRGHDPRNYPAMAHTGVSAMLGLALARECGVSVDRETFQRGLAYLERKGAPVGQIIYGDAFRDRPRNIDPEQMLAGQLTTENGKLPEAAVLYEILGDRRSAHFNSHISTHAWYSTYGGHGGHFWDVYWTPLGSAVQSKDAYIYFMKNHRWFRECNRMFDGSLITGGKADAASGLALVVPRRRLRILGAPKSPFSPDAPDILKPALGAYHARNYAEAETLARALLDQPKVERNAVPTIRKLAEEAKRMQESIASDLAAMAELSKEGRLYETGLIMASLKPVISGTDPRLAEAIDQMDHAEARPDDRALYMAALKSGAGMDSDEASAKSAADLKKIREAKKTALEAEAPLREWKNLTSRVFFPKNKRSKPKLGHAPVEQATKWQMKVVETREHAPEGWMNPGFDDTAWTTVRHPVSWHLNHTALHRATFTVEDCDAYDLLKFKSWVFRQQNVAIYLNGTLIGRINNVEKKTGTIEHEFKRAAMAALKNGKNTIAIATRQNWRWGMLFMKVYNNGGFDFILLARLAGDEEHSD